MTLMAEIAKRHYKEHPLAGLTDDELLVIDELSQRSAMFCNEIAEALDVLGALATYETSDREFKEQVAREEARCPTP